MCMCIIYLRALTLSLPCLTRVNIVKLINNVIKGLIDRKCLREDEEMVEPKRM